MATLIRQTKVPRNAIAPVKIEMEGLFDLDVDDDIWLDIGLGYDDDDDEGDGSAPPLWLSNDDVRAGIRAMLDRDRCLEERKRLLDERSVMQEWFSEEWKVVTMAMQDSRFFLNSHLQINSQWVLFRRIGPRSSISAGSPKGETLSSFRYMGAHHCRGSINGRFT